MTTSQLELELTSFIIKTLDLEDLDPEKINSNDPLFSDGWGLDSIDALELGVALTKRYNVALDNNSEETRQHFMSVKTLALFIENFRISKESSVENTSKADNQSETEQ
jgi:acyl carrier protein